jgi:Protein of unknown function (DUF1360)
MATEKASEPAHALREAYESYGLEPERLSSYAALIGVFNAGFAGVLLGARLTGRELPRLTAGDLALFGVATHKLSRTLAKDKITAALRAPFTERAGDGGPAEVEERPRGRGLRRSIGELVGCPYCLDQWVATGFVSGAIFAPRATRLVAGIFSSVALADFLQIAYKAGQKKL